MTSGHTHRTISVKRDGLVHRVLRAHLFHTDNLARVDPSPYPYGECYYGGYYLNLLSILHRWTGLTLELKK